MVKPVTGCYIPEVDVRISENVLKSTSFPRYAPIFTFEIFLKSSREVPFEILTVSRSGHSMDQYTHI